MEWKFFINWPAIVEEAKQRRKKQRLTQATLARMANVSTPTVSRFENGEKDIQLSTVISILNVLGMNDKRHLIFSERNEHDKPSRTCVVFTGQDADKIIECAISWEALQDYFGSDGRKNNLKVFQANRESIQQIARRKYLAGNFELDGSILLKSSDFD
jgi:transcriptional regulator with XRE-family HTH domain